jgi:hypothetical protein
MFRLNIRHPQAINNHNVIYIMYNKITSSNKIKIMFSFSDVERNTCLVGWMAYVNVCQTVGM